MQVLFIIILRYLDLVEKLWFYRFFLLIFITSMVKFTYCCAQNNLKGGVSGFLNFTQTSSTKTMISASVNRRDNMWMHSVVCGTNFRLVVRSARFALRQKCMHTVFTTLMIRLLPFCETSCLKHLNPIYLLSNILDKFIYKHT